MISAHTRVAAVIGDPIRHSLSPVIFNAAFAALELDWVYVAFPVEAGRALAGIEAARTFDIQGLSVTMPHKTDVIAGLDELTPTALRLGAVNAISWKGPSLVGDSTDGRGFLDALRHDEGFDPAGTRCAVLGAGGAARAVVLALAQAGAEEILVINRTAAKAEAAAELAGDAGRVANQAEVAGVDLVVNATSIGMAGVEPDALPVEPKLLHSGQIVADLVYVPLRTPLLAAARERGAVAVNGLGMLIHQAAHAFRAWTGEDPPLEVMSAAAMAALSPRS